MNSPHLGSLLAGVVLFALAVVPAHAQEYGVRFEDVSKSAMGSPPVGPSFGAGAWGDFNQDGYPDLWLGNHALEAQLWVNDRQGGFLDRTKTWMPGMDSVDSHGAAWADFDNDGDLDLIECVGSRFGTGVGPNRLWLSRYPQPFAEVAGLAGLAYPNGRSRTPLWFDWNADGLLDVVITAFESSKSRDVLFTQQPGGGFLPEPLSSGFQPTFQNTRFAQLGDFDTDGKMELLLQSRNFPDSAMEYGPAGFTAIDLPPGMDPVRNVQDVVVGNFDGDFDLDFYLTREPYWSSDEVAIGPDGALRVAAKVRAGELRMVFRCAGTLRAELIEGIDPSFLLLGSQRVPADRLPLVLRQGDRRVWGKQAGTAQEGDAVYLGREPDSDYWECVAASAQETEVAMILRSDEAIKLVSVEGLREREPSPDILLWSSPTEPRYEALDPQFEGRAAVAADFDNDGDLDLYVVQSGAAVNRPNRLYDNVGDEFVEIPQAAGAAGSLLGVGDGVSVADYDCDGFLDILITNGAGLRPLSLDGPVQLFRNQGNSHHWLQIDLIGATTKDAIGAIVQVTTPQGTQRRDQTGGMTRSTQSHARLHFGLGPHEQVSELRIVWPNRKVDIYHDVPADQILTIRQR